MCIYIYYVCNKYMSDIQMTPPLWLNGTELNKYMHNILIIHRCMYRFIIYTYVCLYIKVYYRGLAHVIVNTGKSKLCGVSAGLRPREESKAVGWQNSFLFRKGLSLFFLWPSVCWIKPNHVMKGSQLYSKSIDLNVNLIQKWKQHLKWCLTKYWHIKLSITSPHFYAFIL